MTRKIKTFFKSYAPIIILSLIIGFLVVKPTIFSIAKIGWTNFQGVYPIITDDEEYYLARTREVLDGHYGLGSAYLKEHKAEPYMAPPLAEIIFASAARALHISIPALFAFNDFFFPFLTCLALYYLFLCLTGSKKISCSLAFFLSLLYLREMGRPINQQLSFFLLILAMISVWKIYRGENNLKKIILNNLILGCFFAALLYIYPYFWTTLLAVYGLILVARLAIDRDWFYALKNILAFSVSAFILALPYLYNLARAIKNPAYQETIQRLGLINTHWPGAYFNVTFIFLAAVILFFCRSYLNKQEFYFSVALITAGLILNWQNVITGKYLWFSTHYNQATVFLLFTVAALLIKNVFPDNFKNRPRGRMAAAAVLVIVFLGSVFYYQWPSVKTALAADISAEEMRGLQELRPVFDWFNQNTAKDSAVLYLIGNKINLYPIYTHNNMYSFGFAGLFLMPNSELEKRWLRQNMINSSFDENYIRSHPESPSINFLPAYQNALVRQKILRLLSGSREAAAPMIPREYTDHLVDEFKTAKKEGLEKAMKDYQLNYILLDAADPEYRRLENEFKKYSFLKQLKQFDDKVMIYRVD